MARIRTIKPEFWRSPDVMALSYFERLLYIGLWNLADDEGRGVFDPAAIAADLFLTEYSLSPHGVLTEVSCAFERYEKQGMLAVYEVKNRRFFQILNWSDHQRPNRPSASKFPPLDQGKRIIHGGLTEDSVNAHGGLTAGTGNREQGSGTGNREQGTREYRSEANASSLLRNDEPHTASEQARKRGEPREPEHFAHFWDTYGKKVDKPGAIRAWNKATTRAAPADIIAAADAYTTRQRQLGKHPQYTANPATWLNRDGWNDDLPPAHNVPRTSPSNPLAHLRDHYTGENPFGDDPTIIQAEILEIESDTE